MEIAEIVFKYRATNEKQEKVRKLITEFYNQFKPIEDKLYILMDSITKAIYCECHISGESITSLGSIDSPLDAENQAEYRANRDVMEDSLAFFQMKEDATQKRSFSNIVAEYNTKFESEKPLKIIGGQHRYLAIQEAIEKGISQIHGVKVYFELNTEQRLDVQLISNTNIAVSSDLLDRMMETIKGPELRNWCQSVGLLKDGEDFADRKQRGNRITVRAARTFVLNYFNGASIKSINFPRQKTIPVIAKTGGVDIDWEQLKQTKPNIWNDLGLIDAGKLMLL